MSRMVKEFHGPQCRDRVGRLERSVANKVEIHRWAYATKRVPTFWNLS